MIYDWDQDKNKKLKKERGISFEAMVSAIEHGGLLQNTKHHNAEKYPHQRIFIIAYQDYVYLVPFVKKDQKTLFLKTIVPSRKATRDFLIYQTS